MVVQEQDLDALISVHFLPSSFLISHGCFLFGVENHNFPLFPKQSIVVYANHNLPTIHELTIRIDI